MMAKRTLIHLPWPGWPHAIIALLLLGMLAAVLIRQHLQAAPLDTARDWARLAPLPASASDLDITTTGSAFSREFVITFTAPAADVDAWLKSSPGTSSVTPRRDGPVRRYAITPGGGAAFAEVTVDEDSGRVTIRTYWS